MTRRAIAGAAGIALVATLFLPWVKMTSGWIVVFDDARPITGSTSASTAWEASSSLDILLALLAVAFPFKRFAAPLALAIVVALLIASEPDIGPWLALVATAVGVAASRRLPSLRRHGRLRRAELLAGLGGTLLLVAPFLHWYAIEPIPGTSAEILERLPGATLSAWQAYELLPVALLIAAALAIAVPLLSLSSSGPAQPIGATVVSSAVGWIAVALVLYATLFAPEDWPGLRAGVWLALAGSVLAWVGSWLSMRDDSTPGAVAPDVPRRPAPVRTAPEVAP